MSTSISAGIGNIPCFASFLIDNLNFKLACLLIIIIIIFFFCNVIIQYGEAAHTAFKKSTLKERMVSDFPYN